MVGCMPCNLRYTSTRLLWPRAASVRHYTDVLPDVSIDEIDLALKQKNGEAPSEVGATTEILRAGELLSWSMVVLLRERDKTQDPKNSL